MDRVTTFCVLSLVLVSSVSLAGESVCYGTTSSGWLEEGVKLPSSGVNFVSYSSVAELLGRTYVHSEVRSIVVSSFKALEIEMPTKVYKYAETGFKAGGKFKPHKTHQNGLSIDFMTPVTNREGDSVHLPTNILNKLGYNIEFDDRGKYEEYRIDYDALAAHLVNLDKAAKNEGLGLWRVIFDPQLQLHLFNTDYGDYLKTHIQFSKKRSWVRHDEHYHVDFEVPCRE